MAKQPGEKDNNLIKKSRFKQRKIVLSGYYGFDNAGDEAVLFSILKELRRLMPDLAITVLSNNPAKTSAIYQVKAVNRWHVPAVLKALAGSDLLISGGGSLLQDITGPKSIVYYVGVVQLAQLLRVPTFFYSQGIGPVNGAVGKKLISIVVNRVDKITVRDAGSAKLLESLAVTKPEVTVTADPVLGIAKDEIDLSFGKNLLSRLLPESKGTLGIALRDWAKMDEVVPLLAKWCNEVMGQRWNICLIPFHLPNDSELSQKLYEKLSKERNFLPDKCVLLDGGYLPEEYLSILGNLDFMISMRLHGLIMAAVMEVPMTGICYDPKVDSFLQQVNQPICATLDESIEVGQMLVSLTTFLEERSKLKEQLRAELPELKAKARMAAQIVVEGIR